MHKIKILSDYTSTETPNFLQIIRDDQGDIHIKAIESDENSCGIRIAVEGTRHSPEIRKAFYNLIEAYENEISTTHNSDIVNLNR